MTHNCLWVRDGQPGSAIRLLYRNSLQASGMQSGPVRTRAEAAGEHEGQWPENNWRHTPHTSQTNSASRAASIPLLRYRFAVARLLRLRYSLHCSVCTAPTDPAVRDESCRTALIVASGSQAGPCRLHSCPPPLRGLPITLSSLEQEA